MARHFLRLRLSLLASNLKRGWQPATGLILAAVTVVPLAGLAAFGLYAAGRSGGVGATVTPLAFAVLALGWVVVPPLMFGVDETLDPARLRLLPLTRRQLLVGLTVAGAIGIGPLATLLVLGGAAVGAAAAPAALVLALVAVGVQLALCLVVARAVTTALSRRLRSRKGRDVVAIVAALLGLVAAGLGQIPNLLLNVADVEENPQIVLDALARAADVAGLTPFGWAGRAVVAAADGTWPAALGWLAAAVLLVAALARWWAASLEHALTAPTGDVGDAPPDEDLFPRALRWLPRNRLGASAARELRYAWRVPQLRAQWVTLPVFGVAYVVITVVFGWLGDQAALGVPLLVVFSGFGALNQFGADRGAVWLLLVTGDDLRSDLAGKNLAAALLLLPFAVVLSVAVAAVTGGWGSVAPAILASCAAVAVGYGVGDLASVLAPQPMPETANLWAGTTGTGCATALLQLVALLAQALLLLPVVALVGAAALWRPQLLWPAAIVGLLYALGTWWLCLRAAAATARTRGPELLAALTTRS